MKALGESSGRPQAVKKTSWTVDFHSDFASEVRRLPESVREKLKAAAIILAEGGPDLGRPYADTLKGSRHGNMKELRFDADGGVWRVAYAFDPARNGILLAAGDKSGNAMERFYRSLISLADVRFDQHLKSLRLKKEAQ